MKMTFHNHDVEGNIDYHNILHITNTCYLTQFTYTALLGVVLPIP